MKNRENDCAFPADSRTMSDGGMTLREYFAAKALQGLCAGRTEYEDPMIDVNKAVKLADLLLSALANER